MILILNICREYYLWVLWNYGSCQTTNHLRAFSSSLANSTQLAVVFPVSTPILPSSKPNHRWSATVAAILPKSLGSFPQTSPANPIFSMTLSPINPTLFLAFFSEFCFSLSCRYHQLRSLRCFWFPRYTTNKTDVRHLWQQNSGDQFQPNLLEFNKPPKKTAQPHFVISPKRIGAHAPSHLAIFVFISWFLVA